MTVSFSVTPSILSALATSTYGLELCIFVSFGFLLTLTLQDCICAVSSIPNLLLWCSQLDQAASRQYPQSTPSISKVLSIVLLSLILVLQPLTLALVLSTPSCHFPGSLSITPSGTFSLGSLMLLDLHALSTCPHFRLTIPLGCSPARVLDAPSSRHSSLPNSSLHWLPSFLLLPFLSQRNLWPLSLSTIPCLHYIAPKPTLIELPVLRVITTRNMGETGNFST